MLSLSVTHYRGNYQLPKSRRIKTKKVKREFIDAAEAMLDPLAKTDPPAVTPQEKEAISTVLGDSYDAYKDEMVKLLKGSAHGLVTRLKSEINNLPPHHLAIAYGILHDKLRDFTGEATQRIEVTRKGITPDQFNALLDKLPSQKEVIDVTPKAEG